MLRRGRWMPVRIFPSSPFISYILSLYIIVLHLNGFHVRRPNQEKGGSGGNSSLTRPSSQYTLRRWLCSAAICSSYVRYLSRASSLMFDPFRTDTTDRQRILGPPQHTKPPYGITAGNSQARKKSKRHCMQSRNTPTARMMEGRYIRLISIRSRRS